MFESFATGYDCAVNFIEAHEQANKMINGVVENEGLCEIVLKEARENIEMAQKYIAIEIEEVFPEISKSIQHRRAEYYILAKQSKFV